MKHKKGTKRAPARDKPLHQSWAEIADRDCEWFKAHPSRSYRVRLASRGEIEGVERYGKDLDLAAAVARVENAALIAVVCQIIPGVRVRKWMVAPHTIPDNEEVARELWRRLSVGEASA